MINHDIKPDLAAIVCDTLVVRGEKDPIAPQRWTEIVTSIIPKAECVTLTNGPHCVNYVLSTELTETIVNFISRH